MPEGDGRSPSPDSDPFASIPMQALVLERKLDLRLRDIERPMANFFASGIFNLRGKLGPLLWQFPPSLPYDAGRFGDFLELLPRDTEAALRLARRRDARMHGRSVLRIDACRPLRHAVEIRHESFATPEFVAQLRQHGVALVVADTAGKWPCLEDATADFMYLRLHGAQQLYASGYTASQLAAWAERIRAWAAGSAPQDVRRLSDVPPPSHGPRNVFCFFDNTGESHAPRDALALARRLALDEQLRIRC